MWRERRHSTRTPFIGKSSVCLDQDTFFSFSQLLLFTRLLTNVIVVFSDLLWLETDVVSHRFSAKRKESVCVSLEQGSSSFRLLLIIILLQFGRRLRFLKERKRNLWSKGHSGRGFFLSRADSFTHTYGSRFTWNVVIISPLFPSRSNRVERDKEPKNRRCDDLSVVFNGWLGTLRRQPVARGRRATQRACYYILDCRRLLL